ncbi:MAG: S1 RNA-binding domain-containing protein [Candidatus Colwellbacteria bacterium]|nr:S1 RNA-binding domain-containing protein [Candidatus Colwellbacteria bacterium]
MQKNSNHLELQMLKSNPSLMTLLKEGDLIDVNFIERGGRAAYFEIPRIGTGVVYGMELTNAKGILKNLTIGEAVTAKVLAPENDEGMAELSLTEAGKQKAWQEVRELKEQGEPIKIQVTGANTGGLIASVAGLQAFLPASQLSNEHYPQNPDGNRQKLLETLNQFVGQELTVKIINVNPRSNKLIVSEREVVTENVKELLAQYSVGQVVSGIISGVANFGAFIRFADNPEIEGLVHISELSHNIIDHPKEVVKVGDMIEAQIAEIKDGRVSLSLKALQPNPWEKVGERFEAGMKVRGVVHRLNPFGAFVKLDEDIMGLIHVSEFGSIEELKKNLEPGQSYDFLIDKVAPEEKRIILKLSQPITPPAAAPEAIDEPGSENPIASQAE